MGESWWLERLKKRLPSAKGAQRCQQTNFQVLFSDVVRSFRRLLVPGAEYV